MAPFAASRTKEAAPALPFGAGNSPGTIALPETRRAPRTRAPMIADGANKARAVRGRRGAIAEPAPTESAPPRADGSPHAPPPRTPSRGRRKGLPGRLLRPVPPR